jgi:hypothetical protein
MGHSADWLLLTEAECPNSNARTQYKRRALHGRIMTAPLHGGQRPGISSAAAPQTLKAQRGQLPRSARRVGRSCAGGREGGAAATSQEEEALGRGAATLAPPRARGCRMGARMQRKTSAGLGRGGRERIQNGRAVLEGRCWQYWVRVRGHGVELLSRKEGCRVACQTQYDG